MKTFVTASVLYLCINLCLSAKVLQYDLFAQHTAHSPKFLLSREGGNKTISEDVSNLLEDYSYHISVEVGTPPQTIKLNLATSSRVTVLVAKGGACSTWSCTTPFDHDASSSYRLARKDEFKVVYVKGQATGDIITENFVLGSSQHPVRLVVGLVNAFDSAFITSGTGAGILGIGYGTDPNDPSGPGSNPDEDLPTIVDQLIDGGLINTRLYSVWLNSLQSPAGNVLFGGIDTNKFIGNLTSVPLRQGPDGYSSCTVFLKSLSIVNNEPEITLDISLGELPEPVGLDTGTTWTILPKLAVQKIYNFLGVVVRDGSPLLDCRMGSRSESHLAFEFENGIKIKVYYTQLITKAEASRFPYTDLPFEEVCLLGIYSNEVSQGYSILGHSFLRSAYVVFDVDNNRIGIAQTNLQSTTPDIHEVTAGDNHIPRVSLDPTKSQSGSSTESKASTSHREVASTTRTTSTAISASSPSSPTIASDVVSNGAFGLHCASFASMAMLLAIGFALQFMA